VLSGTGFVDLFEFLCEGVRLPVPASLAAAMKTEDPAAAITEAALAGTAPIASEAVAMFVTIYGAEAGNLALKLMATGGVWIGGGIVRKIRPLIEDGRFMAAFLDKGRFRGLLADVPVHVILDENAALYGALSYLGKRLDASRERREP
jgi:glucokinase